MIKGIPSVAKASVSRRTRTKGRTHGRRTRTHRTSK
jgi:hypothetical protein